MSVIKHMGPVDFHTMEEKILWNQWCHNCLVTNILQKIYSLVVSKEKKCIQPLNNLRGS